MSAVLRVTGPPRCERLIVSMLHDSVYDMGHCLRIEFVSVCWHDCVLEGSCVCGLQVPMMGNGVVEALVATLTAVQGGGARALEVQRIACDALQKFAVSADNRVR